MGRIGGIKALLAAGARIDVRNENEATAIHLAASNGHVSALEVLRAHGASLYCWTSSAMRRSTSLRCA